MRIEKTDSFSPYTMVLPIRKAVFSYRRVEQVIRGRIESFSVFFQPVALSLLFGLPAMTITNADLDARGVLGRFVGGLRERLGNCGSFLERVLVAEEFFVDLSSKTPRFDIIESVAHEIRRQRGVCQIDAVARFVRRALKKSSTNSERRGLRRFNARSHYFGTVVFLANNMPQLPPEKIYEL
jgi:hypothetical protein